MLTGNDGMKVVQVVLHCEALDNRTGKIARLRFARAARIDEEINARSDNRENNDEEEDDRARAALPFYSGSPHLQLHLKRSVAEPSPANHLAIPDQGAVLLIASVAAEPIA